MIVANCRSLNGRGVEGIELANKNAIGPGIRGDMVQCQDQMMLYLVKPKQRGTDWQIMGEVEKMLAFMFCKQVSEECCFLYGKSAEINMHKRKARCRLDDLDGLRLEHFKGRAQDLVTTDDSL